MYQPTEIDWQPCPLQDDSSESELTAECATLRMPLSHGDPQDPRSVGIAVKRLLAKVQPARAQLHFLRGGPGYPGTPVLGSFIAKFEGLWDDVDTYTLDHRGTGSSEFLDCPALNADKVNPWDPLSCFTEAAEPWGSGIDTFNTTESSWDLAALIHATRAPDQQVLVWGGSYGSYWAQRYLQLIPEQPDGVILEGIVAPGLGFQDFDRGMNATGQDLMTLCEETPSCASHFETDPWDETSALLDALDQGHCPEAGIDREALRYTLGRMLYYDGIHQLVPAVVYRLKRCSKQDLDALAHLNEGLFGDQGVLVKQGMSAMLYYHVVFSELWLGPEPRDRSVLETELESYTMASGGSVSLSEWATSWPAYREPLDNLYSDYQGPLLMLQGGLDPATPYDQARELVEVYDQPLQTWATFPSGAHGVVGHAPTRKEDLDCGIQIYDQFVRDPYAKPDLSCLKALAPLDFNGDPDWNEHLLGTTDAWGDGEVVARPPGPQGMSSRRTYLEPGF